MSLKCIAWGGDAPHMDCPVVLRNAEEAAVPVTVKLPAVCPCECKTCKRAWWDDGRPRIDRKTGEIVRTTDKANKRIVLVDDVFKRRGMIIRPSCFECPYCQRTIHRGGHAEGFRKSGMSHHIHACWELVVYWCGYFIGEYIRGPRYGERAIPIEEARATDWGKRFLRSIKATMRRRAKDGELAALQATLKTRRRI